MVGTAWYSGMYGRVKDFPRSLAQEVDRALGKPDQELDGDDDLEPWERQMMAWAATAEHKEE